MSRVRSADYEDKVRNVVNEAASLFAVHGYPGVRMNDIAEACGVSKSMLYHYFATKEDILFFIIREFLEELIATLEKYSSRSEIQPVLDLQDFVVSFVFRSTRSRQRNLVSTNDVKYLPADKREAIRELERRTIDLAARLISLVRPDLARELHRPLAFILMGTLTWTDRWYRPEGRLDQPALARLISQVFLDGINSLRGQALSDNTEEEQLLL